MIGGATTGAGVGVPVTAGVATAATGATATGALATGTGRAVVTCRPLAYAEVEDGSRVDGVTRNGAFVVGGGLKATAKERHAPQRQPGGLGTRAYRRATRFLRLSTASYPWKATVHWRLRLYVLHHQQQQQQHVSAFRKRSQRSSWLDAPQRREVFIHAHVFRHVVEELGRRLGVRCRGLARHQALQMLGRHFQTQNTL